MSATAPLLPVRLFAAETAAARQRQGAVEPRQGEREVAPPESAEAEVSEVDARALAVGQLLADGQRRRVVPLGLVEAAEQQRHAAEVTARVAGAVGLRRAGLRVECERALVSVARPAVVPELVVDQRTAVEHRRPQQWRVERAEDGQRLVVGGQRVGIPPLQPAHLADVAQRAAHLLAVVEAALEQQRLLVKLHRPPVVAEILVADADVAEHHRLAASITGGARQLKGFFKEGQRGLGPLRDVCGSRPGEGRGGLVGRRSRTRACHGRGGRDEHRHHATRGHGQSRRMVKGTAGARVVLPSGSTAATAT